ncbi:MAG: hypothetical protein ACI9EF_001725, partial [Pseudohongiellaceae bacterium]
KIEVLVRGSIRDLAFWWLDGAAAGDADLLLHNPQALQALETALGQVIRSAADSEEFAEHGEALKALARSCHDGLRALQRLRQSIQDGLLASITGLFVWDLDWRGSNSAPLFSSLWSRVQLERSQGLELSRGLSSEGVADPCSLWDRIEALIIREAVAGPPAVALQLAQVLQQGTAWVAGPQRCEELVDRLSGLMEKEAAFVTPEIALLLVMAMSNVTAEKLGPQHRLAWVDRMAALRERDDSYRTLETALELARGLLNTSAVDPNPGSREELADRIEALIVEDSRNATPEMALQLAAALYNTTVVEPDPRFAVKLLPIASKR